MHASTLLALAFSALAMAAPALTPRNNDIYATFYNDDHCTQGAGKPVDVNNPGCLNESGRRSIYFQAGFDDSDKLLIESVNANCPCQNNCQLLALNAHNSNAFCQTINLTAYRSLRFIKGTNCPKNNC